MANQYTPADMLGNVVPVDCRHEAIDADDECSCCGKRLRRRESARQLVYLADCGRFCSRRCAHEHAEFLAREMNRRHAEDN